MLEESDVENAVEVSASSDVVALSPIPDDPSPGRVHYVRQRSRWRRILRTALPLQAMLVLLLGAACLVPHCDDESCCQLLNNFARSFDPSLEFAMLVLLLGAACLVPHCDDESCCQLLNNFARSFDPSLEFVNGPPPF
ncbi:unnamed protein product [Brugia pahangi]|uniref:KASH domain-containing protein n=1 Tax=Brugia pahangi TaxID=6280 RepID=A0A0N4THM5_BRUPA|nr:unnamed protein product [Brugia pahangi]